MKMNENRRTDLIISIIMFKFLPFLKNLKVMLTNSELSSVECFQFSIFLSSLAKQKLIFCTDHRSKYF